MSGQGTPITRYGQLRASLLAAAPARVREPIRGAVSERLLQLIWQEQRVCRPLRTRDGQRLTVRFPGWWNGEAGPDFRQAILQLSHRTLRGDVEVHVRLADWFQHHHDRDPRYANVVLHVVLWDEPPPRADVNEPVVALADQLDAPLEQLAAELDPDRIPLREPSCGRACARALQQMPVARLQALLGEAGLDRLERKAHRLGERMHAVSVAQTCYEGWMEALGYKANKTGFRLLARRLVWWPQPPAPMADCAAVLFGLANFLPVRRADAYTRALWDRWWKWRAEWEDRVLPASVWNFTGHRPINHPHRRLAAAATLLRQRGDVWPACRQALLQDDDPSRVFRGLEDEYWSRHCTLGGRPMKQPAELIGAARAEEIVVNVILPLAFALGRDEPVLRQRAEQQFLRRRPTAPHSVMLRAVAHLLPAQPRVLTTAAHQQGLLQVFEDFCLQSDQPNGQCRLPELVARWQQGRPRPLHPDERGAAAFDSRPVNR